MEIKKQPLMIAHRGASGYELENTKEAFIGAGNRLFFGIETDIRITKDGHLVTFHDEDLTRLAGIEEKIENLNLEQVLTIPLIGKFSHQLNYNIATFDEYLRICKYYHKRAIIELKHGFNAFYIDKLIQTVRLNDMLENSIFISFDISYLLSIRKKLPNHQIQYLTGKELDDERINICLENRFDLDLQKGLVTPEIIHLFHRYHLKINAWTVDDLNEASRLAKMGIDYITSNILEKM